MAFFRASPLTDLPTCFMTVNVLQSASQGHCSARFSQHRIFRIPDTWIHHSACVSKSMHSVWPRCGLTAIRYESLLLFRASSTRHIRIAQLYKAAWTKLFPGFASSSACTSVAAYALFAALLTMSGTAGLRCRLIHHSHERTLKSRPGHRAWQRGMLQAVLIMLSDAAICIQNAETSLSGVSEMKRLEHEAAL